MNRIKRRVYEILTDPPSGDVFGNFINISILLLIAVNVIVGIFESVKGLHTRYPNFFYYFEFASVMVFSVEYVLRLWACNALERYEGLFRGRLRQASEPMAIIDLLAILPFYIQLLMPSGLDLRFIRVLRLMRLFRIFRVGRLAESFRILASVIKGKKEELFISSVVLIITLVLSSSLMFIVESHQPDTKFTSVPASMWWGMMTITTIGYGDMYPMTEWGRVLGAIVGFCGICIFALPVGILGAGFIEEVERKHQDESGPAVAFPMERFAKLEEQVALLVKLAQQGECPHCGEDLASHDASAHEKEPTDDEG